MLVKHGLDKKILTFNADNASNNDTQMAKLEELPNSFDSVNRVRCFNHTMQLSARALLRPLNNTKSTNEGIELDDVDMAGFNNLGDDDEDENGAVLDDCVDENEDDEDLLDGLDDEAKEDLIDSTKEAADALQKVSLFFKMQITAADYLNQLRSLAFAIVHSTTKALPAWHEACKTHDLSSRLVPRDVKTRWNSTYDMISIALQYWLVLDEITANKALKMRKYELDNDDWAILKDVARVLKVSQL